MKGRVAIIGTVGIPAKYGGFETLAEQLVRFKTHAFTYVVFCSSTVYGKSAPGIYAGARLVYLPLRAQGPQSIFYDIASVVIALRKCDILLMLGTSGCVVLPLVKLISRRRIIVNIDGLEHKRQKWNFAVRMFLKFSESIAVKFSDIVIADNREIQKYIVSQYGKQSRLIEYGGDNVSSYNATDCHSADCDGLPKNYFFKVCRIEPENNVEMILSAFQDMPAHNLVIVGNWDASSYGMKLKTAYSGFPNIFLKDPIYDTTVLNRLRKNCSWYLHGHSAGGTNPSLVEAMYLKLNIVTFDVPFNRETTEDKAVYFKSKKELEGFIDAASNRLIRPNGSQMKEIADRRYRWKIISEKYLQVFEEILQKRVGRKRRQME